MSIMFQTCTYSKYDLKKRMKGIADSDGTDVDLLWTNSEELIF